MDAKLRQSVRKRHFDFERKLELTVQEMLRTSAEALRRTAQCGPRLAGHLEQQVNVDKMDLDSLDKGTRIYERMIKTSRSALGLDAVERNDVNVSLTVNQGPTLRSVDVIDVNPVNEQSVAEQQPAAPSDTTV